MFTTAYVSTTEPLEQRHLKSCFGKNKILCSKINFTCIKLFICLMHECQTIYLKAFVQLHHDCVLLASQWGLNECILSILLSCGTVHLMYDRFYIQFTKRTFWYGNVSRNWIFDCLNVVSVHASLSLYFTAHWLLLIANGTEPGECYKVTFHRLI